MTTFPNLRRCVGSNALVATFCMATAIAVAQPSAGAAPNTEWSPAEKLIFDDSQLQAVKPPTALRYAFARRGSLDEAVSDDVRIDLRPADGGSCCVADGDFLSGNRKLTLPPIEDAHANPVILYFLEYDVREMQRRTGGQQAHFRRRIRMALAESAKVNDVVVKHAGRDWPAKEVRITPYLDDPNRNRFEQLATKEYVFVLVPGVPGGVYQIRTLVADAKTGDKLPLIEESVTLADRAARP